MARKPGDSRPDNAPEKLAMPDEASVLDYINSCAVPPSLRDITRAFKIGQDQRASMRRMLRDMAERGILAGDRRGIAAPDTLPEIAVLELIDFDDNGDGMARQAGNENENQPEIRVILSRRAGRAPAAGQQVLARLARVGPALYEARIIRVLDRQQKRLFGVVVPAGKGFRLQPADRGKRDSLVLTAHDKITLKAGDLIEAELLPSRGYIGKNARVIANLGNAGSPGAFSALALAEFSIRHQFPDAAISESQGLKIPPVKGRRDLRDHPLVTIDGADARDFDDAVYCEVADGGFRLWVAIADVSHYVPVASALDKEATLRGNSVYFPERVVPMFPEALSNGLCSLKPRVDRLAMVAELKISAEGEVVDSFFYEAVIHSHARLTYTQVGEVLDEGWHDDVPTERYPELSRLHALYRVLRSARDRRGAIDFDTVETRIIFNDDRKIESITPVHRNDAHKVIEECMLAANVATAHFLESSELAALFRVHDGPSAERLENLRRFLGELALDLPGGDAPTPADYQRVLSAIAEREDASVIQTMMLRSLSQAVYQPANNGHFGLHYSAYAHFTSPIRRYPDLLVHRAIRHLIRSRTPCSQVRRVAGAGVLKKEQIYPYSVADIAMLGEQCSMTERRADDATREVEAWLKCEFLRDKVGEVYSGVIAAVTGFGIFVELVDLYIEGLVHISALPGDYYHFDQAKQRLIGEHTRRVFQLGGAVTVKVARVDLDERKIDLEMDGLPDPKKNLKGKKSPARHRAGSTGAAKKPSSAPASRSKKGRRGRNK